MDHPILYRKRIIPAECVLLKDDRILFLDDSVIVTGWQALHPKPDLACGFSCYYLDEGFKISKFCREDKSLIHWYCDIVDFGDGIRDGKLIATDLLADVIISPDGAVRIVDLDELEDAFNRGLINSLQFETCLSHLAHLLMRLRTDGIDRLTEPIGRFSDQ
ncbi:MAG: DUF402 domain-containing protein [Lachnospiraceae bacterium]|nr:DUF402 domain-containing protein [Lachnospiraceae bacterium]